MAQHQKFLFDTCFDESAETMSAMVEPKRQETTPLTADDQAALVEEGRRRGRAEAQESLDAAILATLDHLIDGMRHLHQDREILAEDMRHGAVKVALALVQKMLPAMTKRHGLDEIEGMIRESLSQLVGEPRVVIRVPDNMLDPLRERIDGAAAAAGFAGDTVLLADPALGAGDCRVEWADGGAERDSARLWKNVEEAAGRLFAGAAAGASKNPAPVEP